MSGDLETTEFIEQRSHCGDDTPEPMVVAFAEVSGENAMPPADDVGEP